MELLHSDTVLLPKCRACKRLDLRGLEKLYGERTKTYVSTSVATIFNIKQIFLYLILYMYIFICICTITDMYCMFMSVYIYPSIYLSICVCVYEVVSVVSDSLLPCGL